MVALMQLSIDVIMDVPFKMDITLLQGCVFFFFDVSLKIEFVLIWMLTMEFFPEYIRLV